MRWRRGLLRGWLEVEPEAAVLYAKQTKNPKKKYKKQSTITKHHNKQQPHKHQHNSNYYLSKYHTRNTNTSNEEKSNIGGRPN